MNSVTQSDEHVHLHVNNSQPLTAELLAEQNEPYDDKLNAIRAWAADLPQVPDTVEPILTTTHIFELDSLTLDDEEEEIPESNDEPRIQETKDVFSDTQKIAYVGLCYLTSLEVVYDFQGQDFTFARMSADNWQRKTMRMIYCHMNISPDEIKMIESLSKHDILPSDLVHQFTSQGETTKVTLQQNQVIVDLRWTVMCDLFLICLSTENYDARSRVFIARIASYLSLDWFQVIGFEKRIAEHLIQDADNWETETVTTVATTMTYTDGGPLKNDIERSGRNKQRRKKRYVMIGLATIGGGLILGLSAGLMAPVIAGGIGAILTTVGVTGTAGFLGGTTGIALITGGATLAGGRIGGRSMHKRMKTVRTFEFLPIHAAENVNCVITITGWLPKNDKEETWLPFSTMDPIMGDHYSLYWEPEMLEELGSAFRIFATEAVTFTVQQALAHTIMGALLAGLAWPLALTKLGYMVDNPWNNALDRSKLAGLILADTLMNRNLGARPITLVGYSLGARVIFFCLLELARVKAYGLVENVVLFGTPVSASKKEWKECTTVVSGRFVNGYATNDWLLGFLFRTSTAGLGNIAGLRPLLHIEGNRVQNVDCTDLLSGHLAYRSAMPKLLKRVGFVVTSEELPIKEEDMDSLSSTTKQNNEPERTVSSSTAPQTPQNETPRTSHEAASDFDIIADIIANATAAASSKSGTYSSLSSGKASIASTPREATSPREEAKKGFFKSKSERSLFSASLFTRKKVESEEEKELRDAGIQVKEIKGTLGRLVVPNEIANPMPQVKLEAPQHARLNK